MNNLDWLDDKSLKLLMQDKEKERLSCIKRLEELCNFLKIANQELKSRKLKNGK